MQALGLPYRVVNVAAGDLGDPAAKKYDIEAWFPRQQRYREITSTSNTTDFQARRLEIRYRAGEKRLETPHTLNGTAVTDRWLLAILENFQEADGSIVVPKPLTEFGAPRASAPSAHAPSSVTARGGVPERSNGAVLKTADGATRPWVQIPPPP